VCDLNNIECIEESLSEFLQANNIDISAFVHCAGYLKMVPLRNMSLTHLQQTMNVNFTSAALLIKLLINKKVNNSSLQNVVFISSTASIMGAKAFNVYSASKGALDSLMRSLAVELAPNIRLNSVLPGGIQTKMTDSIFNDTSLLERMAKEYPLGLGEPNDISEMVQFLLSEKAKWITGQQFVVDGGRSINITG
jgi:NAD(P)-dependent dehydrogenase (short-subunit alcohol dehydrogenase family)